MAKKRLVLFTSNQEIIDLEAKALQSLARAKLAKDNNLPLVEALEREEAKKCYQAALKLAAPLALDIDGI